LEEALSKSILQQSQLAKRGVVQIKAELETKCMGPIAETRVIQFKKRVFIN